MNQQLSNRAGRSATGREESHQRGQVPPGGVHARFPAILGIIMTSVLMIVGLVAVAVRQHQSSVTSTVYAAIDHIPCRSDDPRGMHIHAHLTIYISGKRTPVPGNIGIAPDGSCLYWLHTHDTSGIIHVEAPTGSSFTLGNFLDIWSHRFRQLGYPAQLSDPAGWQAYVNGLRVTGDLYSIRLSSHALITLTYNSPGVTPDTSYAWGDY